jgi:hypothetical protein
LRSTTGTRRDEVLTHISYASNGISPELHSHFPDNRTRDLILDHCQINLGRVKNLSIATTIETRQDTHIKGLESKIAILESSRITLRAQKGLVVVFSHQVTAIAHWISLGCTRRPRNTQGPVKTFSTTVYRCETRPRQPSNPAISTEDWKNHERLTEFTAA